VPGVAPSTVVVAGLIVFGAVFALNSAVHSYLILAYTDSDKVAMSVGFYYMANAAGRLAGTVLSGALYQWGLQSGPSNGLIACLWASSAFVLVAGLLSLLLPRNPGPRSKPIKLEKPAPLIDFSPCRWPCCRVAPRCAATGCTCRYGRYATANRS
jgi:MFS family permease